MRTNSCRVTAASPLAFDVLKFILVNNGISAFPKMDSVDWGKFLSILQQPRHIRKSTRTIIGCGLLD